MAKIKNVDKKKILQKIKNKEANRPRKRNLTFRFDEALIERFDQDCENEGVSMNKVVESLIEDYLGI